MTARADPDAPDQSPAAERSLADPALISTSIAVLLGAVILLIAVTDEPYHIDELRQVRSYDRSFRAIAGASFAQEQPPLDALVNGAVQRIIGLGDGRQRIVSVLAGIGSLGLIGALTRRAGLRFGSAIAVLTMALSPALVAVTAYARPYALPLFLMLAFLYVADLWLESRQRWAIPILFLVALLLPLSRTSEPPLFLGAAIGVMSIGWWIRRHDPWPGSPGLVVGAAAAGLIFVEIPVWRRLSPELSDYSDQGSATLTEQLGRFWNELPGVAADVIPAWPFAVLVILACAVMTQSRRTLSSVWWFWVMLMVPIGFALVFFVRTPTTQPFFGRYAYSWIPALAVIVGATSEAVIEQARRREWRVPVVVGSLILVLIAGTSLRLTDDLSTTDGADWSAAAALVAAETPPGTVVLFDDVRRLGRYRTFFAGVPRYTQASLPMSTQIIANPDLVPEDAPIAVMLLGARPDVEGWTQYPADDWFTLYLSDEPIEGRPAAAAAMSDFGDALGPARGAALTLAAVAALQASGLQREAAAELEALIERADSNLNRQIARYTDILGLPGPAGFVTAERSESPLTIACFPIECSRCHTSATKSISRSTAPTSSGSRSA